MFIKVTASSNCLFDYLRSQEISELQRICDLIAFMYETHLNNDRIVQPMLSFLDKLLGSGKLCPFIFLLSSIYQSIMLFFHCILSILGTVEAVLKDPNSKFALQIFNLTRSALGGKTDRYKLLQSIDVYCQLIQVCFIPKNYNSLVLIIINTVVGKDRIGLKIECVQYIVHSFSLIHNNPRCKSVFILYMPS